jgi:signal transduction histidine kinase
MDNLLSNAAKYSPAGANIYISCRTTGGFAEVEVRDEGYGIKASDIDKLFHRFYRVDNKDNQSITGFGIGLYLCAEIIERHQGKIWVKSEEGKGSSFYFSLPLEK